jgi:hypothetical protein
MDEFDVIYVDDDERNARDRDRDSRHRTQQGRTGVIGTVRRPNRAVLVPRRSLNGNSDHRTAPSAVVVQSQAPSSGLAGLSAGDLIEMASQLLAAIQPLPAAPVAVGAVGVDVENLVVYQTALATHAKRDEQLRTIGTLLGRILNR